MFQNKGVGIEVIEHKKDDAVDRQKVCPFLLRVFVSTNGHHHKCVDYAKGNTPDNELQMYTWKDATLSELAMLVKEVNPTTRQKGTKFSFAIVYPEVRAPGYRMRDIGTVLSGQKGPDDLQSLAQVHFSIGDYLDIAVTQPENWKTYQNYGNHRNRQY